VPSLKRNFGNSYYETQGQGPPLLLLNGLGFSRWSWSWQWQGMPSDLQMILLENRGLGSSDIDDQSFDLADLADDAAHLLDHLGLEKAVVFGVSMGGMIAQEFALRHPQRCAGLALGCTWCGGPDTVTMTNEVLALMGKLAREGWQNDLARQALALNFGPAAPESMQQRYAYLRAKYASPPEIWARQREATLRFDSSQNLPAYQGPALLMHGGEDPVVPFANLQSLHSRLPQAQVVTFPTARHLFWIEHHDEVNARLRDFCLQCFR